MSPTAPPTPSSITSDPLLTTKEAAALLRLVPETLERLRWRGDSPPYVKLGHRVLYRLSTLQQWIAARERTSTAPDVLPITRKRRKAPR